MRRCVLVTALACASAWAEPPRTVDVERATVWSPGADAPLELGSGCYLREDVCVRAGKELVQLRTENTELKKAPDVPVVLVSVVAVLAFGTGYAAAELLK